MTSARAKASNLQALSVGLLIASSLAVGSPAEAQTVPDSPGHLPVPSAPWPVRSGFVAGLALGGGPLLVRDCPSGVCEIDTFARFSGPNLKVGWMLKPNWALWAYVPTGVHVRGGVKRAFEALIPALQYWVTDRVWLRGGIGLALDFPLLFSTPKGFFFGPAASVGIGVELTRWRSFVIDVEARVLAGSVVVQGNRARQSSAFDLLVGINWY